MVAWGKDHGGFQSPEGVLVCNEEHTAKQKLIALKIKMERNEVNSRHSGSY